MAKYASVLGVGWAEVGKLRRACAAAGKNLDHIEKNARFWVGEDGGYALNRKAANSIAEYIKADIWKEGSKSYGVSNLSPWWVARKNDPNLWDGKTLQPHIGIATETYVNSIRALDMGKGRFQVGVPNDLYVTGFVIGTITHVATYAKILEFGNAVYDVSQPPRPVFAYAFKAWAKEESTKVAAPFIRLMNKHIARLARNFKAPYREKSVDAISGGGIAGDDRLLRIEVDDDPTLGAVIARQEERIKRRRIVPPVQPPTPQKVKASKVKPDPAPRPTRSKVNVFEKKPGVMETNVEVLKKLKETDYKFIDGVKHIWNAIDQRWQTMETWASRRSGIFIPKGR